MFTLMFQGAHKPDTLRHKTQKWSSLLFAFLLLIFATTMLLFIDYATSGLMFYVSKLKKIQFSFHAPTLEFVNGTNVIWQIPNSPKAVLFLAHGCNGKAANFWDKSKHCPDCVGLPEERHIVLSALAHRFAVIAISSSGRCWSFGKDIEKAKQIIDWWINRMGLEKLPLTALGASSGGYFVSNLATRIKFSSVAVMIAEGAFEYMEIPDEYPPTLFVHMPKDHKRSQLISKNMETLKMRGILVSEIKCMEFPLTPTLLSDRIPELDKTVSERIFEVLQERGIIDRKGFMVSDGRMVLWKHALAQKKVLLPERFEWINHIEEELNLAFAYHEMTSLPIEKILHWFESHMVSREAALTYINSSQHSKMNETKA